MSPWTLPRDLLGEVGVVGTPNLSVVVPTHDTREVTVRCLERLRQEAPAAEVVVVDDGSRDGTATAIEESFPEVAVLRNDRPLGYSSSVNRGVAATHGPVVLLLNSDTEVLPGAVAELLDALGRFPRLGIAGSSLRYPDGQKQWSGGAAPGLLWLFALATGLGALTSGLRSCSEHRGPGIGRKVEPIDWVSGAAMAVRRDVWNEVGPFDETYRFYCQDLDLCLSARGRGWDVALVHGFAVVHQHGATIGQRSGAVCHQNPEILWSDLLLWARKARGRAWSRAAGLVLWAGTLVRLVGRIAKGWVLPPEEPEAWSSQNRTYARAARVAYGFSFGR